MTRLEFEQEAVRRITEQLASQGVRNVEKHIMRQLVEMVVEGCHKAGWRYEEYAWAELEICWFGEEAQRAMVERDYYGLTVH